MGHGMGGQRGIDLKPDTASATRSGIRVQGRVLNQHGRQGELTCRPRPKPPSWKTSQRAPAHKAGKHIVKHQQREREAEKDNQLQACIALSPKHYAQKVIHDIPLFTCNLTHQSCVNGASEAGE